MHSTEWSGLAMSSRGVKLGWGIVERLVIVDAVDIGHRACAVNVYVDTDKLKASKERGSGDELI